MMLEEYNKKRNFGRTPEPQGDKKGLGDNKSRRFVVQKHDATKLHYDFRLEDTKEGVLKSWAVPKGISLDPKIKRLAVLTEDHPLDYLLFEGIIPEGSYGAGTVIVWDTGTFSSEQEISDQFEKGKINFSLFGQKLRGKFTLVRIRSRGGEENQWLLMKSSDGLESEEDLTISRPESVLTGKTIENLKDNEDIKERRTKSSSVAQATKSKSARDLEGSFKIQTSEAQGVFANNFSKLTNKRQREDFVTKIKPMLSTLVDKPFDKLDEVYTKLKAMRIEKCPIDHVPYTNRDPIWIRPELVAEIKFSDWTEEKIMRAPIFLRFREDKAPTDCLIEGEKPTQKVLEEPVKEGKPKEPKEEDSENEPAKNDNDSYSSSFSNLDKVFWDKTSTHPQLTKKDLIKYYDNISSYILPYLKDRPLSLSRYPNGIKGKSFYHNNLDQENKSPYVQSAKIYSESRKGNKINYTECNNKETLLWLANLACIEMHPWYSRINNFNLCQERDDILYEEKCGLNFPDFIIFDLDPYIYSGLEGKGQEPEYNHKGFKAAIEVAYLLKDLFDDLKIESFIKTSGKTGLHIFVPIANLYTYGQTRAFAEAVGKILLKRHPEKITMEWETRKRKGRVFFDHNQNARGKTIASIFSARPTESATVSIPIQWKDLQSILPTDYTILNVPDILRRSPNPWRNVLERKQDLNKILKDISGL